MNEPNFPMDDDLSRFEQELKSLTPRDFPVGLPVRAMLPMHDLGLTSPPDVGIVTNQQSHRQPFVNRAWLKTVSVSWMTGLAAGLLVSMIWTRLVNEDAPFIDPKLISESGVPSVATDPNPPTTSSRDLPSTETTRPQESSRFREQSFGTNFRSISLNSYDGKILHPMMSLREVDWIFSIMPPAKRLTGVVKEAIQDHEHSSAPNSTSDVPQTTLPNSFPNSFPKAQGQRQLLKSLMESNELISI